MTPLNLASICQLAVVYRRVVTRERVTKWNKNDKGDSIRSIDFSLKVSRSRRDDATPFFYYRFSMNRKRLNKEPLIADAFVSPTCRHDFVGLRHPAVRSGRGSGLTPERVTKCLSSREERKRMREEERERAKEGGGGASRRRSLSSHTTSFDPST